MTKTERAKLSDLLERHEILVKRVKKFDSKPWEDMTETEIRCLDHCYGECIGIEVALTAFKVPFVSVDDR